MSDLHVFDSNGDAQYPEQGGMSTHIRNAWGNKRYLVVDASNSSKAPTIVCYVNARRPGGDRKQYYLVFQGSSPERIYQEFLDAVDAELADWEFITGEETRQDVFAALRQEPNSPHPQPSLVDSCLDETMVRCEASSFDDAVGLIRSLDVSGRRFVVAENENGVGEADLGIHRNPRLGSRIRFDDETAALIEEQKTTQLREQALDGIAEYAEAVTPDEFLQTVSEEILNRKIPDHTVVEPEALEEETQGTVDPVLSSGGKFILSAFVGVLVGIIVGFIIALSLGDTLLAATETTAALTIDFLSSTASSLLGGLLSSVNVAGVVAIPVWSLVVVGFIIAVTLIGFGFYVLGISEKLPVGIGSKLPQQTLSDGAASGTLTLLEPTGGAAVTSPVTVRGQSKNARVTITVQRGDTKIAQKKSKVIEETFHTQFKIQETGQYDIVVVDGSGKKAVTVKITGENYGDSWTLN